MKKRFVSMLLALMMCLTLIPPIALAAENVAMVDEITIRFERAGHTYEMTFTNVADVVINYTEDGCTWPNTIFYYPGATVSVTENLDNTDNFLNGFYGEAEFHPGEAGMVKANTLHSVEAKYAEIFYLICGKDARIEDSTGILGAGPLFLMPWSDDNSSWMGYQETTASIYDYRVKDTSADTSSGWGTEQANAAIAARSVSENLQKNYTQAVSHGDAAELTGQISIQIPGCNAIFTLENVSPEYVIATSPDEIPTYRFALPGTTGMVACNQPADVTFGQTWEDVNPQYSGFGGGGDTKPAGWSERYPIRWLESPDLNGRGLQTVELTVYEDGTLDDWSKPAAMRIIFYLGYPVSYSGGPLPDDLISWEWKDTTPPGAMAGGPPVIEHVNLPKHPVSELAVAPAAGSPSS